MSVFIPKFVVIKSQQTFTHSWHWNRWTVSCWTDLRLLQESPTQVSHLFYHIENLLKLDGYLQFYYFYRKKWASVEKNMVILHQFERGKFTPNVSPFPLKLETYLRMTGIPYEVK
jgi:hypothetical protein